MKKMFKFICLKYLFFFCVISTAQASSYYDLKESITREFSDFELKSLCYTKYAYVASEHFRFSSQFLNQTQEMMKREAIFRHKCNVKEETNIAQLCIYGSYKGTSDWKFIEIFDLRSCKGHFYLSGNDPVLFAPEKKPNDSSSIDVQKISHERGYMQIHQRLQPLLDTIKYTVQFLENIGQFVENQNSETLELGKKAFSKNKEIMELMDKKNEIIKDLEKQAHQLEESQDKPDAIITSTNQFMIGILRELARCLEEDDFNFNEMKDAVNNAHLKKLISSIHQKLSKRKLNDLFNSKYFNLGCSEPLLLFDLFSDELDRTKLINEIRRALFDQQLDTIWVQLHSTKTPCKSCLIGCCGHLYQGAIKAFFEDVCKAVKSSLKREDINLRFLISYQMPYEDEYPFYVPVASDLSFSSNSILIVNMQLYDEQFRRMKKRIIEEEELRKTNLLSKKLKEKGGTLTEADFKAIGLLK